MIQTVTIHAKPRSGSGKGIARKLRAEGRLPGVVYGRTMETLPLAMDFKEFTDSLRTAAGANVLIRLEVPEVEAVHGKTVMVRELQRDPLSGLPIHADLIEVRMDEKIRVEVPLHFVGKARGVAEGGILQEMHRSLLIECLPTAIPEAVEVDVSNLGIGQTLHLSDITLAEGLRAVSEVDLPLAHVLILRAEEPAAAAAPTEEGAEAAPAAGEEKDTKEKDKKEKKEE